MNFTGHDFSSDDLTQLVRVERYIDDYAKHSKMLLADRLTLKDYVTTCLGESGVSMNETLAAALSKLQAEFGEVPEPGQWLGSGLSKSEAV